MATNSISSFQKLPNLLKGYNPGTACSPPPSEIFLYDTHKGLPLVPIHRNEVLTCSSLLHIVRKVVKTHQYLFMMSYMLILDSTGYEPHTRSMRSSVSQSGLNLRISSGSFIGRHNFVCIGSVYATCIAYSGAQINLEILCFHKLVS